jgi:hypothetical protein
MVDLIGPELLLAHKAPINGKHEEELKPCGTLAGGALLPRGLSGGEQEGGPENPQHGLQELGLMVPLDGRGGIEGNGKGEGGLGGGRGQGRGVHRGLLFPRCLLLILAGCCSTKCSCSNANPGNSLLDGREEPDPSGLLVAVVEHECSLSKVYSMDGALVGSSIGDRIMDSCQRAAFSSQHAAERDVTLSPGDLDSPRALGLARLNEGLPEVSIAVQLYRPLEMLLRQELGRYAGCIIAVCGNVHTTGSSDAVEDTSNLTSSAGRKRLKDLAGSGNSRNSMNDPNVSDVGILKLIAADSDMMSAREPSAESTSSIRGMT